MFQSIYYARLVAESTVVEHADEGPAEEELVVEELLVEEISIDGMCGVY